MSQGNCIDDFIATLASEAEKTPITFARLIEIKEQFNPCFESIKASNPPPSPADPGGLILSTTAGTAASIITSFCTSFSSIIGWSVEGYLPDRYFIEPVSTR